VCQPSLPKESKLSPLFFFQCVSILNLDNSHSLIPGGGLFVEKVPLGVTVRRIQFIDDPKISSASHPLYAVLVSKELESDMSHVNDDGLTAEERQRLADEKENAKIKRQVEADLGGFDIEQEWVEEIEREDCFKIDTSLGGAPPSHSSVYSLWIVDAASGWIVVDSYEFESSEHALNMQVMSLSEVSSQSCSRWYVHPFSVC
jgi:cleavage and polyadenylation specificity factor subunit 1